MVNSPQSGLFADDQTIAQRFEAWRQTRGGRHVMFFAYQKFAGLIARAQPRQRISMKLVWELLRFELPWMQARLRAKGIEITKEDGFRLNNVFTAYIARHVASRRPDWAERIELRELNTQRQGRIFKEAGARNAKPGDSAATTQDSNRSPKI